MKGWLHYKAGGHRQQSCPQGPEAVPRELCGDRRRWVTYDGADDAAGRSSENLDFDPVLRAHHRLLMLLDDLAWYLAKGNYLRL